MTTQREAQTRIRILVHWSRINPRFSDRKDQSFETNSAAETMANFIGSLIRAFGRQWAERLTSMHVGGKYPLSRNPTVDFLNPVNGTIYGNKLVPNTNLYVFTHAGNPQKCDDIKRLVRELRFPADSIDVSIIPKLSSAELGADQLAKAIALAEED